MRVGIVGTGKYIPDAVLDNQRLEELVDSSNEWILTRTGIASRRIIGPSAPIPQSSEAYDEKIWEWLESTENVYMMGARAGLDALQSAGIDAKDITLLVASCNSPLFIFPGPADIIKKMMGASNAEPWSITSGCTSPIFHIKHIDNYLKQHGGIAVSICTDALSATVDWTDRRYCVLFGDSAGSTVYAPVESGGILSCMLGSEPSFEIAQRSGLESQTLESSPLAFSRKDLIERHYFYMNGQEVYKFATRVMGGGQVPGALDKALAAAGKELEDIDLLIPHQANIRIIDAAIKRCGVPKEKTMLTVEHYGNNSAASIPVALDIAIKERRAKKGDTIALVGFGAGLTYGASIIEL